MRRLLLVVMAFSFYPTSFTSRAVGQPDSVVLEGTVQDVHTKVGIPNLTMRLIPPNNVRSPERIVRTDSRGNFRFTDPNNHYHGRHLLEVYQGAQLLFRDEINTLQLRRIAVPVRPVN
jgi:hypothetical protein